LSAAIRERVDHLGDFSLGRRVLTITACAVPIGAIGAVAALALLRLIGLITNLVFYQRFDTRLVAPGVGHHQPLLILLAPVVGGLLIGLMARFGSEKIRGHGMPEAIEAILTRGSRVDPRVAVLKPISAAISIGSGGPFGAEGPIIMTGGAVGSVLAQTLHMSADERKTLLVAGAAAGMAATFNAPLASVLLAVELLLFEWRPRSLLPAALAAVSAEAVREALARAGLVHPAPLFPVHALAHLPAAALPGALAVGIAGGGLAFVMTRCVYAAEDAFARLPLHWCWWPALGGLVVGLGGLLDPRVLGAGYGTIRAELAGQLAVGALALLLVCKLAVWSIALGSNTSGGILAPLLMMGAALGGLLGAVLPGADQGTWALLGMAAAMAGTMRSPLTSVVFALELTRDVGALPALLLACAVAHLASVLALKRSILTEKIARRGWHVSREYEVDPLQALFVRDVMQVDVRTAAADASAEQLYAQLPEGSVARRQRLYPVLGADGGIDGVLAFSDVLAAREQGATAGELARVPLVAHPDETLRTAADRMVAAGHGVLPVVARADPRRLVGLVSHFDLLAAHQRVLVEERRRERPLSPRRLIGVGALLPARERV